MALQTLEAALVSQVVAQFIQKGLPSTSGVTFEYEFTLMANGSVVSGADAIETRDHDGTGGVGVDFVGGTIATPTWTFTTVGADVEDIEFTAPAGGWSNVDGLRIRVQDKAATLTGYTTPEVLALAKMTLSGGGAMPASVPESAVIRVLTLTIDWDGEYDDAATS